MHWLSDPIGGTSAVVALQTPASIGWIVAVGIVVVLAYSGVVASRRSSSTGPESVGPPFETSEPKPTATSVPTDEERVIRLLESNGGRMRQTRIVEETGWSKSKVSMLLSEMDDGGRISKLRVGRENIVSRSGSEPEAMRSPLETGA